MTLTQDQKDQAMVAVRESFRKRGGIAAVRAEMDQFHDLNMRVVAEFPALRKIYPNQWVCMDMKEILVVGASQEEVLDEVQRRNIDISGAIVEYIDDEDTVLIL